MIKLNRPLCFLDIESTDLDVATARIVSLTIVKIPPDEKLAGYGTKEWLVNPGVTMGPEVIEIHGITNERVKNLPLFKTKAGEVLEYVTGCDLAGFNLKNYDVPLLWEEFYRSGIAWDLRDVRMVDAGSIFKKFEERSLSAAVKFYCGREHEDAHSATGDVLATIDVLQAQIERYNLSPLVADLAGAGIEEHRVDLAGKIVIDRDGDYAYNFGQVRFNHKTRVGAKVKDDTGLASWALNKDFPMETKLTIRRILEEIYGGARANSSQKTMF